MRHCKWTPLLLLITWAGVAWGQGTRAAEGVGLREVGRIELAGVEGRIDHLAVDGEGKRLYVAALGSGKLEVIDLGAGKRVGEVEGFKEPQGVGVVADGKRVVVASGGDGVVRFVDAGGLKVVGEIKGMEDADNVRYDAKGKRVYVGYGEGAVAAIDPGKGEKVGEVEVGGHPESFQLEEGGPRVFVNVPKTGEVVVVDREKLRVVDRWRLPEGVGGNFPMAVDEGNRRVFVGCRGPARVVVMDTGSGRVVGQVKCVGDADDLFYDKERGCVYVIGGEGAVTVIRQVDADKYEVVGRVGTAAGARTGLFVPRLSRLFVAVPHRGAGQRAEVRVFEGGKN